MSLKSLIEKMDSIITEGTKETSTGRVHKAEPGGYGRKDDEDSEGKKVEPTVKRGRGRPKKNADSETGEVKKFDFAKDLQSFMVGNLPGGKAPGKKGQVHKIKDESIEESTGVTDFAPKSKGGTRKELIAKYKKSKNPKDAEAARKAGATQKELQAVAEGTKETSTGKIHKAEPGGYGRKDDEDDEGKKVQPQVKRGRGRPKKDADSSTGEVKKWDTDELSRWIVGSKPKTLPGKASVKHKLKDWMEHVEREMIVESITQEGRMGDVDALMQGLASGEADIYDVMNNPSTPEEQYASKILQNMYDDVVIDSGLHPDDDFEEIIDMMADRLAQEYGAELDEATTVALPIVNRPSGSGGAKPVSTAGTNTSSTSTTGTGSGVGQAVISSSTSDPTQDAVIKAFQAMVKSGKAQVQMPQVQMTEEEVMEKAPPGEKYERMVLALKKKFPGQEGRAYAIAWDAYNKAHGKKDESIYESKNPERLDEILSDYPHEHNIAQEGWGMHESLYQALCDHYWKEGRIPRDVMYGSSEGLRKHVEECYMEDTQPVMDEGRLGTVGGGIAGAMIGKTPGAALRGARIGDALQDELTTEGDRELAALKVSLPAYARKEQGMDPLSLSDVGTTDKYRVGDKSYSIDDEPLARGTAAVTGQELETLPESELEASLRGSVENMEDDYMNESKIKNKKQGVAEEQINELSKDTLDSVRTRGEHLRGVGRRIGGTMGAGYEKEGERLVKKVDDKFAKGRYTKDEKGVAKKGVSEATGDKEFDDMIPSRGLVPVDEAMRILKMYGFAKVITKQITDDTASNYLDYVFVYTTPNGETRYIPTENGDGNYINPRKLLQIIQRSRLDQKQGVAEETEQIDEVSMEKMLNYVPNAVKDLSNREIRINTGKATANDATKVQDRKKGLSRAAGKIGAKMAPEGVAEGSLNEGYIIQKGSRYLRGYPWELMSWVKIKPRATRFKTKREIQKYADMNGWTIIPADTIKVGTKVFHQKYGEGTVTTTTRDHIAGDVIPGAVVRFADGKKAVDQDTLTVLGQGVAEDKQSYYATERPGISKAQDRENARWIKDIVASRGEKDTDALRKAGRDEAMAGLQKTVDFAKQSGYKIYRSPSGRSIRFINKDLNHEIRARVDNEGDSINVNFIDLTSGISGNDDASYFDQTFKDAYQEVLADHQRKQEPYYASKRTGISKAQDRENARWIKDIVASRQDVAEDRDVQMESWENQLSSLLTEGMTITTSTGNEGASDSVSISATDADAQTLMKMLQNSGLMRGQSSSMSTEPQGDDHAQVTVEPVSADEVMGTLTPGDDGGEEAMGFLKRMLGARGEHSHSDPSDGEQGDYEEEKVDENHADMYNDVPPPPRTLTGQEPKSAYPEEPSTTFRGPNLPSAAASKEAGDLADYRPGGTGTTAAARPAAPAKQPGFLSKAWKGLTGMSEEEDMEEGNKFTGNLAKARAAGKKKADLDGDGDMEKVKETSNDDPATMEAEETCNECGMNESECGGHGEEKLDEWANSPNDSDEQFLADLTFMTKTISGGLNNMKQDQTVLPSARVKTEAERHAGDLSMAEMLRKLQNIN